MINRSLGRNIILLVCIALMSSCVHLAKKYPEIRLYTLDPVRPSAAAPASAVERNLMVRAFSASPACGDASFLLRKNGSLVEKDYHNRFVVSPAELIQDQTASWLRSGALFSNVVTNADSTPGNWELSGHILRLEGDFASKPPVAVMTIQYSLTSEPGQKGSRLFRTYDQRIALKAATPEDLCAAWNDALAAILTALESDITAKFEKK